MPPARIGRPRILLYVLPVALVFLLVFVGVVYGSGRSAQDEVPAPPPTAEATAGARTLYVATDGEDSSAGSAQKPLQTITAAIEKSRSGGTIIVASGSYHEQLKIENRDHLKIVAAPSAEVWLDGSSPVSDWVQVGSTWVASDWRAEFDSSPTFDWGLPDNERPGWQFVDPAHPMAAHPDQVWIDSRRQEQVGSRSQVRKDTFYVDYAAHKLYLGSDPSGLTVRASSMTQALRIRSASTLIRGIGVRRYAPSVPHMGALTVEAPNVTLEKLSVVDNATTGLHVLEAGAKLNQVTVSRNGMVGMTATHADGLQLDGLTARDNNVERFNSSPTAGGVKIGRTTGVVVRDSTFEGNLGNGLWFDESVYDLGVFHSHLMDNAGHGISVELSGKADIAGNVIARNGENGVKINDSDNLSLWNNTFVLNQRPINIVQDDRDLYDQGSFRDTSLPLTWQSRNITVRNNIVAGSTGNCLICMEDFSDRFRARELNVTAASNIYYRPDDESPKWLAVWARGKKEPYIFRTLDQFQKTVGQEDPGQLITETPVLSSTYAPKKNVLRLVDSIAQPMPSELAARLGVPADVKYLGAWPK